MKVLFVCKLISGSEGHYLPGFDVAFIVFTCLFFSGWLYSFSVCICLFMRYPHHKSGIQNPYLKTALLIVKVCFVVYPALLLEILELTLISTAGLGLVDTSAPTARFGSSVVQHEYIQFNSNVIRGIQMVLTVPFIILCGIYSHQDQLPTSTGWLRHQEFLDVIFLVALSINFVKNAL